MDLTSAKIGFVGAGNMASAIIEGLLAKGLAGSSIVASDPSKDKLTDLSAKHGILVAESNEELISQCDLVVMCVKPQVMQQVLEPLRSSLKDKRPILVSIAAGIEMLSLENWSDPELPVVRCMPNTPAQVLEGASGLYANQYVSGDQKNLIEDLFSAVGSVIWVPSEALLHTVTALSGSGPAYFFLFIAEMARVAEKLGLTASAARELAAQTGLGAAKMVLESDLPAEQLKRNVMSPGGTTERAIEVFESGGLPDLIEQAMTAAAHRSEELAALLAEKKS